MPQATQDLQDEWGDFETAMNYLLGRGFKLNRDFSWTRPPNSPVTEKDHRALDYMFQEWDFGDLRRETRG